MINTQRLLKNTRLCKAVTGSSPEELERLLPAFTKSLIRRQYQIKPKEQRKRKIGGGRRGDLPTQLHKLVFILIYLKVYPTFDVMAFLTNRQRSKCHRSVMQFLPVLEMALGRHLALPKRKITSVEEFLQAFPEAREVFLDGTERRVEKPKNLKRRAKLYSGKKKVTTRKNIVVSNEKNASSYSPQLNQADVMTSGLQTSFRLYRTFPPR